jgi:hypothetical protein
MTTMAPRPCEGTVVIPNAVRDLLFWNRKTSV